MADGDKKSIVVKIENVDRRKTRNDKDVAHVYALNLQGQKAKLTCWDMELADKLGKITGQVKMDVVEKVNGEYTNYTIQQAYTNDGTALKPPKSSNGASERPGAARTQGTASDLKAVALREIGEMIRAKMTDDHQYWFEIWINGVRDALGLNDSQQPKSEPQSWFMNSASSDPAPSLTCPFNNVGGLLMWATGLGASRAEIFKMLGVTNALEITDVAAAYNELVNVHGLWSEDTQSSDVLWRQS